MGDGREDGKIADSLRELGEVKVRYCEKRVSVNSSPIPG